MWRVDSLCTAQGVLSKRTSLAAAANPALRMAPTAMPAAVAGQGHKQ